MDLKIDPIETKDRPVIHEIVRRLWGDPMIVVHQEVLDTNMLAGLKATSDGEIIGFLHYQVRSATCEILTLASLKEGIGVGTALIKKVEEVAIQNNCCLLCVITTNDNLHALGFYQRRGFHLAALYPGQVDQARKIKPSIPQFGENHIPLRDELLLEKRLT